MPKKPLQNEMPEFLSEAVKSMQSVMAVNPVVGPQVEQFWNTQEKLLDEAEMFSRHWFQRRHEATRTAMEVARKTTSTGASSPAEAMQVIADWQRHSVERMVEDAREWLDMATRCAQCITDNEVDAVQDAMEETVKTVEKATRKAKSDPV